MYKNFLRKLVGFSFGPIVGAIISFITVPITTFFVSPEIYGKASMFTLFQVMIVTFLYLGFDQAYTREYHESTKKENLLKNSMVIPLFLSFIIFILVCLNTDFFSSILFGSDHYTLTTIFFGFSFIALTIERFVLLSIRMEEKALEYSLVNIIIKFNILLLTVILLVFVTKEFLSIVYANAIGQILGDLYLIIRYNKYLNYKNFELDKKLIIKLFRFGFPLILAASIVTLLNTLDRISLRIWSNFNEIGIFTTALKISSVFTIIQAAFTSFWVPTAYRWFTEKKEIRYFQIVSDVLLLTFSILFIGILILKDYIVLLLSSDYSSTSFILGLLCLQPIMYTLSETTTLGIVFSKKSYLNIYVSILSIIPNILLNFLLVPNYGAVGAAAATGFSYICFFFLRSYYSYKYWKGFALKKHVIISLLMFTAAILNAFNFKNIILINLGILVIILIIQLSTFKLLQNTYRNSRSNIKPV